MDRTAAQLHHRRRVAIVGAGPVGMTLALALARQGVPSLVLERHPTRERVGSRAICQQRDVLDTWDALGAGTLWREGVTWSVGRTYVRDREVRTVHLADPGASLLPAFVNISQARVEECLEGLVEVSPLIEVRRGVEVVGLEQDESGVRLWLGDHEQVEAWWCAVCAGAHADALRGRSGWTSPGLVTPIASSSATSMGDHHAGCGPIARSGGPHRRPRPRGARSRGGRGGDRAVARVPAHAPA